MDDVLVVMRRERDEIPRFVGLTSVWRGEDRPARKAIAENRMSMDQLAGVERLPWSVAPLLEQLRSYQNSLYGTRTGPGTQLGRSHADCGCSQCSPITVVEWNRPHTIVVFIVAAGVKAFHSGCCSRLVTFSQNQKNMFYSQVILAKKGPLAKVWLAAHWGDKKLGRPQIFATDISQSVESIVNPSVPLALRVSGHLLLGVVRIYSRKVKYVLNDCTEAMLKLQMAFLPRKDLLEQTDSKENKAATTVANFGEYDQVHVVEGFALPLPDQNEWILAEDDEEDGEMMTQLANTQQQQQQQQQHSSSPQGNYQPPQEETWVPFDPENEDEDIETDPLNQSLVSEVELVRAADESFLSGDQVSSSIRVLEL
jgi:hypothetical protein